MVQAEATLYKSGPATIMFKGEFVIDDVYKTIKKWFSENRLKFYELLYKDKGDPLDTRMIQIKLYGDRKVTEYYKHKVDVEIGVDNYKEKVITIDNKKQKIGQGKIIIKINGNVIADHKDLFKVEGKSYVKKFYDFLGELLFSIRRVEFAKKEIAALAKELAMLSKAVKKSLNMESTN